MSIEVMKRARDWIAEKPELRTESAGRIVATLCSAIEAAEKVEPVRIATDIRTGERIPLYTIPPDTAALLAEKDVLLKQALEAMIAINSALPFPAAAREISAIRKHLGEAP